MYRQGDVLLIPIRNLPLDTKEIARGRIVLAEGEFTGHTHEIESASAKLVTDKAGNRFLELGEGAALEHPEHRAIHVPAGLYQVIRQREYVPGMLQHVYVTD